MRSSAVRRSKPSAGLDPVALALAVTARRAAGSVEQRVAERVDQELAKRPVPKDGKDADPALVRQLVCEVVAEIPRPRDGKDADPAVIQVMVRAAVDQIPAPKDGKDADPAVIQDMVRAAVDQIPAPKDGTSVTLDDVRPVLGKMVRHAVKLLPLAEDGEPGPMGPMPRHQWEGTRLRFELPEGWGPFVELQGPPGKTSRGPRYMLDAGGGGVTEARVIELIEAHASGGTPRAFSLMMG